MLVAANDARTAAELRDSSPKAKITLANRRGEWYPHERRPHKVLLLSGDEADITEVFSQLHVATSDDLAMRFFLVPNAMATALIGEGGANIKKINDQISGSVYIKEVPGSVDTRLILKGGRKECAHAVAQWILDSQEPFTSDFKKNIAGSYQWEGTEEQTTIFLKLTNGEAAQVMGKRATQIKKICYEFFVFAQMDFESSDHRMLKISGSMGDVHAAHRYVTTLLLNNARG